MADKEFKTIEEQIEILKSRGLTITESDFLDKALTAFSNNVFKNCTATFTINNFNNIIGWTMPTWNGYPKYKHIPDGNGLINMMDVNSPFIPAISSPKA